MMKNIQAVLFLLEDYDFQENSREDLMPKFVADNKDFLLIFYNLNYYEGLDAGESSEKVRISSEKFGGKMLNDTQKEIITLIKEDGTNSALSMAKKLNITSRAVEKNIKVLREQGILVRHGAARGGYWEIKE